MVKSLKITFKNKVMLLENVLEYTSGVKHFFVKMSDENKHPLAFKRENIVCVERKREGRYIKVKMKFNKVLSE